MPQTTTQKGKYQPRRQCWHPIPPIPRWSCLKAAPPRFGFGFIVWQISVWNTPGKKCCNRAHLPGWGREATALESSASGVWAAGIPSYHAVYLPNFKARAAIKAKRGTQRQDWPPLLHPSPSFHQIASHAKMLTSSEHCINICMFTAAAGKKFSLWCWVITSPGR